MAESQSLSTRRAYLKVSAADTGRYFAQSKITKPMLKGTNLYAVLPYTPTVSGVGTTVTYDTDTMTPIQNNFQYPSYKNSVPANINLNFSLTAQTQTEAEYTLAFLTFLKVASKQEFGERTAPTSIGKAPMVMEFNYNGELMFWRTPVVIQSYQYDLPNNIDYISVYNPETKRETFVPVVMTVTMNLLISYNALDVTKNFSLSDIAKGKMAGKYI